MRILNLDTKEPICDLLLMLTEDEASVLSSSIEKLLSSNEPFNHSHINDEDYKREITVAIYNSKNIEDFHVDIQKLIKEDDCSKWQVDSKLAF